MKNIKTIFSHHSPSNYRVISSVALTIFLLLFSINSYATELIWEANPEGPQPDGFKIHYGMESGNYSEHINVDGITSYTLTDLEPGIYYVAITAFNEHGESDFSQEKTFTIEDDDDDPETPSDTGKVTLRWMPNPDGAQPKGFKIYYGENNENFARSIDVENQTSHTLNDLEPGIYHAAITAYNENGESGFSQEITFTVGDDDSDTPSAPGKFAFMEIGETTSTHEWKRVFFENTFTNPVVIAKSMSFNDGDPAVLRIRNIDSAGFEIRIQEWNYLDDQHLQEEVGYIVMEAGGYVLPGGAKVEAGKFTTNKTSCFLRISFDESFNKTPVIVTSITTFNGSDTVTGRLKKVSADGFKFRMQEQEANRQAHTTEEISYIAWEPSENTLGSLAFEVANTADTINHNFKSISFSDQLFSDTPVMIADMQSCDGGDTAGLRWDNKDYQGADIKVEEEQSRDRETRHTTETVGYMLFYINQK
jgi:hypothetical protein